MIRNTILFIVGFFLTAFIGGLPSFIGEYLSLRFCREESCPELLMVSTHIILLLSPFYAGIFTILAFKRNSTLSLRTKLIGYIVPFVLIIVNELLRFTSHMHLWR